MNKLEVKVSNLTNEEIKQAMFLMAPKKLATHEQLIYGIMFDTLESRLEDSDFDYFLDQVDDLIRKGL